MTEFPPELEDLYDRIQSRDLGLIEYCRPKERVIVDICNAIGGVEGEGLYSFWSWDLNQNRIIRSFRAVGATGVAGLLAESRQFRKVIVAGDYDSREREFGEERWKLFNRIEDDLVKEFPKVPEIALDYASQHQVTGKPFTGVERLFISITHPIAYLMSKWIGPID